MTEAGGADGDAILANDAAGTFFAVDRTTLRFLELVRRLGSPRDAAARCGLDGQAGEALTKQLFESGVLVSDDPARPIGRSRRNAGRSKAG